MRAESSDHSKTLHAIQDAVEELQHASRPRKNSIGGLVSWIVALAAGATVACRGFEAAREAPPAGGAGEPSQSAAHRSDPREIPGGNDRTGTESSAKTAQGGKPVTASRATSPSEGAKVEGFAELAKEFVARFNKDECSMRAAALAFVGVLSLVPILLFALAALGFFIHSPVQAEEMVRAIIGQLTPGQQASRAANDFIQSTHIAQSAQTLMHGRWWAVGIGVVSLLWSVISLFVSAAQPMNAAWEVQETRSFIKLRLVALGVFAVSIVLFALSLVPSTGQAAIRHLHVPALDLLSHPSGPVAILISVVLEIFAVTFNVGMFTSIYRLLPNAQVSWRAAAFGGVIAGVLWELFKKGFAVYLAHFGNFNKLYGALGSVFLLVTWIYYSCMVLLGGAILCKMYHEHVSEGGVAPKATR